ncbi:exodeoxyribonuclease VII large subunit [Methylocystis parvus]|uniref:Exodeoxyribonuclease 7 large subunit n=1 Tax=Methylocystis parvus TaxID=134 RepID=A0A6B8MC51_9HYPH|nr:exodeoxyribonuclease VII large subunit [Methylocystis parvus]QGM99189.1 exodeoxyribonuclease VII large subunit [Methylocystis parvus]WBK00432.1 exodeoxyribonuclease VII large subunit [Methylocystis parvus OBBP]
MSDLDPPESGAALSNAPEISVTELANALKRTVEDRFGRVRVRGEISNYRGPHASGHAYFCLKDQGARLDAVIWKGTFQRMRTRPQEGLEVVATGRITTFPGKSSYQIVIEAMEPAGVGALMALLDERRKKLAAEGLFDEARKRPLPFLPQVVGVVTSPTGAVIRDILHRLSDRFPRHVLVWPVRVQGDTSAAEVAAAIEGFNALAPGGPLPRPDVLIVARGGGSLEDLWSFNEEIVVRAAAASAIPLISAIGHETDTTLIDFVSDLRAPTPTGAAEKVVPVRAELAEHLAARARRLASAKSRAMEQRRTQLATLGRLLPTPEQLLQTPRQRLDRSTQLLKATLRARRDARRLRLAELARLLSRHSPQAELAGQRERLKGLGARLRAGFDANVALARHQNAGARQRIDNVAARMRLSWKTQLFQKQDRVERLGRLLDSLSHKKVLERGFALVRDEHDALVRSVAQALPGAALTIEFADGRIAARAGQTDAPESPSAAKRKPRKNGGGEQGSLF